jgi:hypothetical protein
MDCYTRRNVFDAVLEGDVFKHLRHVGPSRDHKQQLEQQQQQEGRWPSAAADGIQPMKQEQEGAAGVPSLQQQQQQELAQQQREQHQMQDIKQGQQHETGTPPPQQQLQTGQASNSQGLQQQQQQQGAASAGQSPDVEMVPAANSSVPGSRDAVAGGAASDGERSRCTSEVGSAAASAASSVALAKTPAAESRVAYLNALRGERDRMLWALGLACHVLRCMCCCWGCVSAGLLSGLHGSFYPTIHNLSALSV